LSDEGYFKRAARTVFADRTWWWKALIVGAVGLVPLVGAFAVLGYHLILMRDATWGVDRGLPPLSEYRGILRQAVNGFVVSLVWGLVLVPPLLVAVLISTAATVARVGTGSAVPLPWWSSYVVTLPALALLVFSNVALLRTAVYVKPSAGLDLKGVLALIRRDLPGFRAVTLSALGVQVLALLLRVPITMVRFIPQVPAAAITYGWGFIVGAIVAPLSFAVFVSYGLWAHGTDASSWPPLESPSVAAPAGPQPDATPEVRTPGSDSPFDDV
jgi:hypothetical protein